MLYKCDSLILPSWKKTKKSEYKPLGADKSVRVDFSHRAIPKNICEKANSGKEHLSAYLKRTREGLAAYQAAKSKKTSEHLNWQCLIGLWPDTITGEVLHKPSLESIRDYRKATGKPAPT